MLLHKSNTDRDVAHPQSRSARFMRSYQASARATGARWTLQRLIANSSTTDRDVVRHHVQLSELNAEKRLLSNSTVFSDRRELLNSNHSAQPWPPTLSTAICSIHSNQKLSLLCLSSNLSAFFLQIISKHHTSCQTENKFSLLPRKLTFPIYNIYMLLQTILRRSSRRKVYA